MDGSVTYRNVCQPSAPRSIDASTIDPDVRRRRAITLLNTTTTQKVACPIMIVHKEKFTPVVFIADRSAMPVMMPGSAIGRTSANDTVSRPKNRKRCTANEARVPSTTATAAATSPILIEFSRPSRIPFAFHATSNHFVVKPVGGHACATLVLKA